jgi:hypothetical protein
MYTDCSHDTASRWLRAKYFRQKPSYSNRRVREIAALERMSAYVERKAIIRTEDRVANLFAELAAQWKRETAHLSSIAAKVSHPAYRRIVDLGPTAIPLIVRKLEAEPGYWFAALRTLTGENPARPEDAGNFRAIRDAWLNWARGRRLL